MSDSNSGAVPAPRPQPAPAFSGGDAAADRGERGGVPVRAVRAGAAARSGCWCWRAGRSPTRSSTGSTSRRATCCRCPGSIFTSMFLHGGWMHLHRQHVVPVDLRRQRRGAAGRRPLRHLLSASSGPWARSPRCFSMPGSTVPMIGASGAVAGVLGGYVMLYPRAQGGDVRRHPVPLAHPGRAGVDLPRASGSWGSSSSPSDSGVAWMAHVGGFLAGLGAVRLLARTRPQPPTAAPEVEYLPPPRRGPRW